MSFQWDIPTCLGMATLAAYLTGWVALWMRLQLGEAHTIYATRPVLKTIALAELVFVGTGALPWLLLCQIPFAAVALAWWNSRITCAYTGVTIVKPGTNLQCRPADIGDLRVELSDPDDDAEITVRRITLELPARGEQVEVQAFDLWRLEHVAHVSGMPCPLALSQQAEMLLRRDMGRWFLFAVFLWIAGFAITGHMVNIV